MATLIDNPEYTPNEIYEIAQTDKVEGAAAGASFGGIGVSNEPHQQLANRTSFLYGRQQTNIVNIAANAASIATLFGLVGPHGIGAFGPGAWHWTVPANIVHAQFILVGGGGGGSSCNGSGALDTTYASGGGGGAGAMVQAILPVSAGQVYGGTVGAAGGPQATGGTTNLYLGSQLLAYATGGGGASFQGVATSAGGSAGTGIVGSGVSGVAFNGGFGSDGQSGNFVFAGNGAAGPWGGAGRAGNQGGVNAPGWGAGGGGAYDSDLSGVQYLGGSGGSGLVIVIY